MSKFVTRISTRGPNGNIFAVLGSATRMMRQLGIGEDQIDALREAVWASHSYDAALALIVEWFPVDRDDE